MKGKRSRNAGERDEIAAISRVARGFAFGQGMVRGSLAGLGLVDGESARHVRLADWMPEGEGWQIRGPGVWILRAQWQKPRDGERGDA